MEKLIVFKKGLIKFAAYTLLFFGVSIFYSCGSSGITEAEYETFLAEKESIPVEILQTTPEGENLYKVPNKLISNCYLNGKRDYCLVLRKVHKEGKTYLQFVKAQIVASNNSYQTVKKLSPGDAFLASPQKLLPKLASMNKLETRKRFLRLQRY